LQQQVEAPIWGKAEPGEKVSVKAEWKKSEVSTNADAAGKWLVKVQTPKASGPYKITIKGKNEIVLKNVLIGEVWFCSGQSNKEMPVGIVKPWFKGVLNCEQERSEANYPKIRLFRIAATSNPKIQDDCQGKWAECDGNSVCNFSAAGYFFGRRIHKELNVPVGMIQSAFGGTPSESWTSIDALEAGFKDLLERQHYDWVVKNSEYDGQLKKWEAEKAKAAAEGKPEPSKPAEPIVLWKQWQPACRQ
jgi:hypothetical protein